MREILFRGKRKDDGEWVYGSLIKRDLGCFIVDESNNSSLRFCSESVFAFDCVLVIPETVGQYTGLTDKNGTKIFEGDIVKEKDVIHNGELQIKGYTYVVEMAEGCWFATYGEMIWFLGEKSKELEVIGNIHDNPELLKGGVDNG